MRETDPVGPDEWLLRRVPNRADYYDSSLPVPLSSQAFTPSKDDADGISLYRELFVSPLVLSLSGRKPPYIVVRIRARDAAELGVTLLATPELGDLPGHVSIPELRYVEKLKGPDQQKQKTLKMGMAQIAKPGLVPDAATPNPG